MEQINNPYEFYFKSTPQAIDASKINLGQFERIYFESGMGAFYPYGEVYLKDEPGLIADKLVFIEGLIFDTKIGNEDEDYIENQYCWSESQLIDTTISNHLSGTVPFILLDSRYKADVEVSSAYVNQKASDVVQDIAENKLGIDSAKIFISTTKGNDTWYQMNETYQTFLKRLADECAPATKNTSPIVTFINLNGEFYFKSINDFFVTQKSVASFKLKFSEYSSISFDHIQDYDLMFGGMPINFDNYTMKVYSVDSECAYSSVDNTIDNYIYKGSGDKIVLRQELKKHTSTRFLGLNEDSVDATYIQGRTNALFRDTNFGIRMNVVVKFNSKCTAGNIITIEEIESNNADKIVAQEYSGKWLISDDRLLLNKDALYMNLTLIKPSMKMDSDHPFIKEFL